MLLWAISVAIDIERNVEVGELELARRGGNPTLIIASREALVTIDYDTICRVDIERRETVFERLLQYPNGRMRHFVGSPSAVGATHILVPRPYSGDVLLLHRETFEPMSRAVTERQPLSAVAIPDDEVLARDWKTGDVLRASLQPASSQKRVYGGHE